MLLTIRTLSLIFATVLLVSACGSSPPVRYYTLSTSSAVTPDDPADAAILGLGPLDIPEYLNRNQIVTRGNGAELIVNDFSHWAEPLDKAVHRVIAAEVDNLMSDVVVVPFPYDAVVRTDVDYRLFGKVDRFEADTSGNVVLDIQWTVAIPGVRMILPPRRSSYEARATSAGDPGSVAAAMDETLRQFSRDIAARLGPVLQE